MRLRHAEGGENIVVTIGAVCESSCTVGDGIAVIGFALMVMAVCYAVTVIARKL